MKKKYTKKQLQTALIRELVRRELYKSLTEGEGGAPPGEEEEEAAADDSTEPDAQPEEPAEEPIEEPTEQPEEEPDAGEEDEPGGNQDKLTILQRVKEDSLR